MIDVIGSGLVLARLPHYVAATTLFGASFFAVYAYEGVEPRALQLWRRRLLLWTAVAAMVSALLWFAFSVANMSGSLSDLIDPEVGWAVLHDTSFGTVWAGRTLVGAAIVLLMVANRSSTTNRRWDVFIAILAAILLASLAGVGHSQAEQGWASVLHITSDAAHLLAAGAWLGGLVPLAYLLCRRSKTSDEEWPTISVLLRFSNMGYLAVTTLVGTGLVNSWYLVGSVPNLLTTAYGQVLLAKLLLFGGMLALAMANRFSLVPAVMGLGPDASAERGDAAPLRKLCKHVLGEQALGAMIIAIVSLLGTMAPGLSK